LKFNDSYDKKNYDGTVQEMTGPHPGSQGSLLQRPASVKHSASNRSQLNYSKLQNNSKLSAHHISSHRSSHRCCIT